MGLIKVVSFVIEVVLILVLVVYKVVQYRNS